jgi:hypothetical protein
MSFISIKDLPECSSCPHTIQYKRRFGVTKHCSFTSVDVTHVKGKSLFCPLITGEVKQHGNTEQ